MNLQDNHLLHPRVFAALSAQATTRYRIWEHAVLTMPVRTPADFAKAIGVDLSQIAKTLFIAERGRSSELRRANPHQYYAAICMSVQNKVNFSHAATTLAWSACELAKATELGSLLGFPPGGVSPLGLGALRVFVDQRLLDHETVLVGGGAVGVEIELSPHDLVQITGGSVQNLT